MTHKNSKYVTKQTRPDLPWPSKGYGTWIIREMLQSEAFLELSLTQTHLLLFVMDRRRYPSKKKLKKGQERFDYWNPSNSKNLTIPYEAFREFYQNQEKATVDSTITKAINKLMHVGFIAPIKQGGNGKGDLSIYEYTHNWRVWKRGDPPCFTKAGMSCIKGFCQPNSGKFYKKQSTCDL